MLGGGEEVDAHHDQRVEIHPEGEEIVEEVDHRRQRAEDHCHEDGREERAGAPALDDEAHRFTDGHPCKRAASDGEEETPKTEKHADAGKDQAGNQREKEGDPETEQVIVPDGGIKDLLLGADAFPAAVAGGGEHGALGADQLVAAIAAQHGLAGGMVGTIGGGGVFGHVFIQCRNFAP